MTFLIYKTILDVVTRVTIHRNHKKLIKNKIINWHCYLLKILFFKLFLKWNFLSVSFFT